MHQPRRQTKNPCGPTTFPNRNDPCEAVTGEERVEVRLDLAPLDAAMRSLVHDLIERHNRHRMNPDELIYLAGLAKMAEAGDIEWEHADLLALLRNM